MNKGIGERIRTRRQELGLSQAELGFKLGIHQKQISAYERGVNLPSSEVLIKMAEVLGLSLDYLAYSKRDVATSKESTGFADGLVERVKALEELTVEERELAFQVLDLIVLKHRMKKLLNS